jgi:serine/threonine protein kinase
MAPPRQPESSGSAGTGPAALSSSFWVGNRLGKYLLTGKLGSGGMGIVYEAEDALLKRKVAIKLLSDTAAAPDIMQRFLQEARAAARLSHPNVVAIHEIDQQSGTYFIVMELLRGGSAQDFLDDQGPFDWPEATRIVADVCRGVQAAHAAGMIHRDIKPANIMRDERGIVKLADFGLAKVLQPSSLGPVTQPGLVAGTPEYMSPEQCRADPIDERTDIYSLGATYYALLTGRPPFQADNPMQVMFGHCTEKIPDVRATKPHVPAWCARIIERALAKRAADRYPSAAALLADLEVVLAMAPAAQQASRWTDVLPQDPARIVPQPAAKASAEALALLAPAQSAGELGRLGPYQVLRVLGEGGMGVVFQARDPALERLVALKVMKSDRADADTSRQRFLQEAKAAAGFHHEHIVTIYQVGEDRGVPYLAMQFLEGEPLDVRLKREGPLPMAELLRIGREVAAGLAAAHNRGLIHRDIKPANIWLEDTKDGRPPRVKLLDFGLARVVRGEEQNLTRTGMVMGTPGYMAPEQARGGGRLDGRCDLFSLGCVLYHMATGQEPFRREDTMATLMALALEEPPAIRSLNPQAPAGLVRLVAALLQKRPQERPESASAVIQHLEGVEREYTMVAPALAAVAKARGMLAATPKMSERLAEAGLSPADDSTEFRPPALEPPSSSTRETPSQGHLQTTFMEGTAAPTGTEVKPVGGTITCPRCGAPGLNPASRAWCLACGYYPEPENPAVVEKKGRLEWLWVLLVGVMVITLLSYGARTYLPHASYSRTWWSGTELILGAIAILFGHLWAFFTTLPKRDDHQIFHYVDFSILWRLTFEYLPDTRRPLWIGVWGGTAVLCAIFMVGGIPYLWKGLPSRMAARPQHAGEGGFRFGKSVLGGAPEEAELVGRQKDLDDDPEKRFSERCPIIGYLQDKDGLVVGLVIGTSREGQLRFAGVISPTLEEATSAEGQKAINTLTSDALVSPPPPGVEVGRAEAWLAKFSGAKILYVKPDVACNVEYAEAAADGTLRDAVFKGW